MREGKKEMTESKQKGIKNRRKKNMEGRDELGKGRSHEEGWKVMDE